MKKFGVYTLVGLLISAIFSGFASCAPAESSVPPDCKIKETYVSNGEADIYGKTYLPESKRREKMPAVILSHSSSLTCDSMNAYAVGFAERGYVAYAFDFCGGSDDSRSDGKTEDMTVFTEVSDLKAVVDAVSAFEFVDESAVYLFGTSQGGLVSALAAEDYADKVRGMILCYPAFNIPDMVAMMDEYASSESGSGSAFGSFGSFGSAGEAFIETMRDYDVYAHIGGFAGKVLILHGTNDFIVPYSYSSRAAEKYANCTLHLISGASHGFNAENYSFSGNYDEEVWEQIDGYFASAA